MLEEAGRLPGLFCLTGSVETVVERRGDSTDFAPGYATTIAALAMNSPMQPVIIREVGLRDGLQSIARVLPTAQKIEWIAGAYGAGQREIEVGSFVPARLLPQLADTAELVAFAKTLPDLTVSVLVPNLRGALNAIECDAHVMLLPLSASHAHSLANLRKTPDEVVREIAAIRAARDAAGSTCIIEVGLSTSFGCTIQGRVEPFEVLRLLRAALDAGAERIGLADTVGYADPAMVRDLFLRAIEVAGDRVTCGHFHDTRGLGLANVYSAWQVGIRRFDACLAGIGGCPHAPGASGNVTTEDVAYLFASMGVPTGQDFDRLLELRAKVAGWLDGETLHGTLWRAGLPRTLEAAPRAGGRVTAA
jgi:hydroxymethylglutaryl-CoA lyase